VLRTTATQRFWNWLGAIPHWFYPTALRSDGELWSQTVIWASMLGSFLALFGLYLGFSQLGRGRGLSPYRGLFYWHHLAGLVFGIVTLTFVASGLVSMNPWMLSMTDEINKRRPVPQPRRIGQAGYVVTTYISDTYQIALIKHLKHIAICN
jgi:hypothetical protein